MPRERYPSDRFDQVSSLHGRVGAHRAENPRLLMRFVLLWAVVAAIVLTGSGIVAVSLVAGRLDLFPQSQQASAAPTPSDTGVIDPSYPVLILNGSGNPDLTQQAKQTLEDAGWSSGVITTATIDQQSQSGDRVYYSSEGTISAARGLASLFGVTSVSKNTSYSPATGTAVPQLILVLGEQSTSAPSASR